MNSKEDAAISATANEASSSLQEPPLWLQHLNASLEQKFSSLTESVSAVESIIVNESSKRDATQARLNAQLLLQSETLVAMELKVLRLEAQLQKHLNISAAGTTNHHPPMTSGKTPKHPTNTSSSNRASNATSTASRMRRPTPHPSTLTSQAQQMISSTARRSNVKHPVHPSIKYPSSTTTAVAVSNAANTMTSTSPPTNNNRISVVEEQPPVAPPAATATFSWPSGASLASGVTGTSNEDGNVIFLMEDMEDLESATSASIPRLLVEQETPQVVLEEEQVSDDDDDDDGDQEDEESMIHDSDSTPTSRHSRRSLPHFALQHVKIAPTLESMLEHQQHQQKKLDRFEEEEDETVGAVCSANDCDGCSSVATTSVTSISFAAAAAATASAKSTTTQHQHEPMVLRVTPTLDAVLLSHDDNINNSKREVCEEEDDCAWISTRAIRGSNDGDEASTLATSVTSATWTTTVTATTRGSAVAAARLLEDDDDDDDGGHDPEGNETIGTLETSDVALLGIALGEEEDEPTKQSSINKQEKQSSKQPPHSVEMVFDTVDTDGQQLLGIRKQTKGYTKTKGFALSSRSQSPNDYFGLEETDNNTSGVVNEGENSVMASVSVVSFSSTMAVAPPRAFTSRRAAAAAVEPSRNERSVSGGAMTNRVVSFVHDPTEGITSYSTRSEAGDSVTMPDELDNMSSVEVVDLFASSSRRWREDYESRLEAIQKQLSGE